MSSLQALIANVGFPIAAFVLMYRLYKNEKKQMREEREEWINSIKQHTKVLRSLKNEIASRKVYVQDETEQTQLNEVTSGDD